MLMIYLTAWRLCSSSVVDLTAWRLGSIGLMVYLTAWRLCSSGLIIFSRMSRRVSDASRISLSLTCTNVHNEQINDNTDLLKCVISKKGCPTSTPQSENRIKEVFQRSCLIMTDRPTNQPTTHMRFHTLPIQNTWNCILCLKIVVK